MHTHHANVQQCFIEVYEHLSSRLSIQLKKPGEVKSSKKYYDLLTSIMILLNTFMMYSLLSCTNLLPSLAAPQLPSGNAQCMAGLLPPGATESRECGEFGESGLGASGATLLRGAVASLTPKKKKNAK